VPPLSEREQKILEEIERGLYDEDPLFAQGRRARPSGSTAGRAKLGALTFVLGLTLLITFFITRLLLIGLLAFGGMVAGIVLLAGSVSAVVRPTKRSVAEWEEKLRKRYRRR
jgi:hypothetical protein